MTLNKYKTLFNYILNRKYVIKKDIESNDILYINFDKFEIKCKYFLIFTLINKNILWTCDNIFIDQKTQFLSKLIKERFSNKKNINKQLKDFFKLNISIEYDNKNINFIWCITGNNNKFINYYIITEIISI